MGVHASFSLLLTVCCERVAHYPLPTPPPAAAAPARPAAQADLIASGNKETGTDKALKESLHRRWEEQKDAKELQQVLRGLDNGFRGRRRGVLGDEGDEGLDGRRRRAREGDDDDGIDLAALMWPAAWGMGAGGGEGGEEEEECDGAELLARAKEQRLLAESRGVSQASPGAVPLDEDSQAVLGMLARSFSESQHGLLAGGAPLQGSDPSASLLLRAPSFVGRQPSVARTTGALGLGGGKSFVFGQRDASNGAATRDAAGGQGGVGEPSGPVSFANLRQMAGMPGEGPAKKRQRPASSLVSRLGGSQGGAKSASQPGVDAASAVCQHVVLGASNRRGR
jgi:hypothetical protein